MNALQLIDATIRAIRQRVFFYLAGTTAIWACAVAVLIVGTPTEYDLIGTICGAIRLVLAPPIVGTDLVPNDATAFGSSVVSCIVTMAVWLFIKLPLARSRAGVCVHISGIVLVTIGVVIMRWIAESVTFAAMVAFGLKSLPWLGFHYRLSSMWCSVWLFAIIAAWLCITLGGKYLLQAHYNRIKIQPPWCATGLAVLLGLYISIATFAIGRVAYSFIPNSNVTFIISSVLPQIGIASSMLLVTLLFTVWFEESIV